MSTLFPVEKIGLPRHIWLASKSPRRRELLHTLGIECTVFLAQTGAEAEALEVPLPQEDPLDYVNRITHLKASTARAAWLKRHLAPTQSAKTPWLLASDTTVAIDTQILGKPDNTEQARAMLKQLSGRSHQVHTAVALAPLINIPDAKILQVVQSSTVWFADLTDAFINAYIDSGEPFDKAGGYGIQGIAGQFVSRIEGSFTGIMGLPLHETANLLRQAVANGS